MRAVVMVRPRRHGGAAAAAAPETRGKEVWEQDRVAGELTEVRFWAEGGRERELDGDGEARRSGNGGRRSASRFRPALGLGRARGGAEWVRGEVARLWVCGIEAGWRGVVGAELGGGSSSSVRDANVRNGEGKDGLEREASRVTARRRAASSAIADAWKLAAGHSGGMGGVRAQYRTGESQ